MLLGGALGNLLDRLFREPGFGRGHVVDFISTPWMMPAIYNIADSFICISMVIFVLLVIFGVNLDGTRTASGGQQATAEPVDAGAAFSAPATDLDEPARASRPADGSRAPHDGREPLGHDAT